MNVSRENEPPQSGFFSSEAEAQAQKIDQFLVTNVKRKYEVFVSQVPRLP